MKQLSALLLSFLFVFALFTGCDSKKDEKEPTGEKSTINKEIETPVNPEDGSVDDSEAVTCFMNNSSIKIASDLESLATENQLKVKYSIITNENAKETYIILITNNSTDTIQLTCNYRFVDEKDYKMVGYQNSYTFPVLAPEETLLLPIEIPSLSSGIDFTKQNTLQLLFDRKPCEPGNASVFPDVKTETAFSENKRGALAFAYQGKTKAVVNEIYMVFSKGGIPVGVEQVRFKGHKKELEPNFVETIEQAYPYPFDSFNVYINAYQKSK